MRFFYHYNKPRSRQLGQPVLSLHYQQRCAIVHGLVCNVPTRSRTRTNRQPWLIMTGKAEKISIRDKVAYID